MKMHPVGSIYISVDATNPSLLFGGTWQQITGRFLLAAGSGYTAGSTGGEATHKLTVAEMPAHTHSAYYRAFPTSGATDTNAFVVFNTGTRSNTGSAGSGAAHNNMPPYLTVYIWKRTA